jgi:hypothetical protein
MFRKALVLALGVATLLTLALMFTAATPAQASKDEPLQCNPCDCPHDNRENCQGIEFYAVYARGTEGSCTMDVYRFNNAGNSRRVMRVTQREIDRLPDSVEENTLIKRADGIELYQLTSGELQFNAGPDANNKVYVMIFNYTCPAEVIREESFVSNAS